MKLFKCACRNVIVTTIVMLLIAPTTSYASPTQKLSRGLKNIVTAPCEIAKYMVLEAAHAKPDVLASFFGVFYGSAKGAGLGISRFSSGLCDILTFPIPYRQGWGALIPVEPFTFDNTEGVSRS